MLSRNGITYTVCDFVNVYGIKHAFFALVESVFWHGGCPSPSEGCRSPGVGGGECWRGCGTQERERGMPITYSRRAADWPGRMFLLATQDVNFLAHSLDSAGPIVERCYYKK